MRITYFGLALSLSPYITKTIAFQKLTSSIWAISTKYLKNGQNSLLLMQFWSIIHRHVLRLTRMRYSMNFGLVQPLLATALTFDKNQNQKIYLSIRHVMRTRKTCPNTNQIRALFNHPLHLSCRPRLRAKKFVDWGEVTLLGMLSEILAWSKEEDALQITKVVALKLHPLIIHGAFQLWVIKQKIVPSHSSNLSRKIKLTTTRIGKS